MKSTTQIRLGSLAAAVLVTFSLPAGAAIFHADFNGLVPGNINGGPGGQFITAHDMVVGASVPGWSNSGAGTIHAVDTANAFSGPLGTGNPRNWGVMFWQDNVITQTAGIAGSNNASVPYSIDFLAAGGVYHAASQVNNGTTDNILIEVLRASDSAVLHSFNHAPLQPIGVGDLGLIPVNFGYTGDGSGDILFRLGPGQPGQRRFQGTIDDLSLTPEPSSVALLGLGGLALLMRRRRNG